MPSCAECRGLNGVLSASTATTAVPPNAPFPAEPSRDTVVAATAETDHSPFIAVSVVTPTIAMRAPFFRRWPAVMVATIGVALVPEVMRMPRAADEIVPRLTCFMDIFSSPHRDRPGDPRRKMAILLRRQRNRAAYPVRRWTPTTHRVEPRRSAETLGECAFYRVNCKRLPRGPGFAPKRSGGTYLA